MRGLDNSNFAFPFLATAVLPLGLGLLLLVAGLSATILAGMFVCGMLGRFWPRYNWQGAVATLVTASATSLIVIANDSWNAFWSNPSIPAVLATLAGGMAVSLLTPASRVTPEQALAILDHERERMEQSPDAALTQAAASSQSTP